MRLLVPAWPPGPHSSATKTLKPSEPAETAAASPAGPPPSTTTSKRRPLTSARRPSSRASWAGGGVAQHAVVAHQDRRLLAGDVEPVEDLVGHGVEVDVVELERDQVPLEQVAHPEGPPRGSAPR